MRVLGIDPGTARTGFGLIEQRERRATLITCGVITTSSKERLERRYLKIFTLLEELFCQYSIDQVAVEGQYLSSFPLKGTSKAASPASLLKLGMVRGIALLVAARQSVDVTTYSPREVKRAVTGGGGANKQSIQRMVSFHLQLTEPPTQDAADALALALCHLSHTVRPSPY